MPGRIVVSIIGYINISMEFSKKIGMAVAAAATAGIALYAVSRMKPDIRKSTYPFAMKDGTILYLDKYESENWLHRRRPVIIFAYGGSFVRGRRDKPQYVDFMNYFARKGYVAIIIDYRKHLRHIAPERKKSTLGFLGALNEAIEFAAEDFADATSFVIEHADEWGIDVDNIIACGSSAGAITVLQTEYAICNGLPVASRLPEGFNYAGVMSFAGAISSKSLPEWKKKPCPIMMFHGDADRQVPFCQAAIRGVGGLWGSTSIAASLKAARAPYYFYIVNNASHEVCKTPMWLYRKVISEFLDKLVRRHKRVRITSQDYHSKETGVQKDFGLKDYIINNM